MWSWIRNKGVLAAVVVLSQVMVARAGTESPQDKFHRAFYLEQASGDWVAAGKLYAEVIGEAGGDAKLKAQAEARQAICREELAGRDFLALMPSETLVYAEIKRPGEQVLKLLEQLGLTAGKEKPAPASGPRVAVSPALIRGILGAGGAAVAVTGFNPMQQVPTGVAVLHAGDLEVVRGFIETALPAAAVPVDPIGGHATYQIEGKVFVTLTSRLVVASTERGPIEGVINRLSGKESKSMASNPRLAEAVKDRGDSLLFFAIDAKMLMPYVQGIAAAAGGAGKEMAIAQAVVDPNSLQSVVGRLGIADDGAHLNLEVRLDKGHHNLVYNFVRTAPINRDTLKCVPEGAAGFLVFALSDASSRFTSTPAAKSDEAPIVTFMDVGREFFANITSVAVYALPPEGQPTGGPSSLPDVAAVITVNDPSKSEALWRQILGLATLAAGAPTMDGATTRIEGAEVRAYKFPDNISVQFATLDNDVLVSVTPSAMARSIRAKRSGASILKDAAFTQSMARLGPDSTKAVFVHPGRCAAIAKPFMPPGEAQEMEQFLPLLSNTVASLVVEHSGEVLRFSGRVSGIPNISGLVAQKLKEEMGDNKAEARRRPDDQGNARAAAPARERKERDPKAGDASAFLAKLKEVAAGKGNASEIAACGDALLKELPGDAKMLNNLAWTLLTEDSFQGEFNELALRLTERSNELAEYGEWTFLDTLAVAKFKAGQVEEAVKWQKKAIKHSKGQAKDELEGRLTEFEAALKQRKASNDPG